MVLVMVTPLPWKAISVSVCVCVVVSVGSGLLPDWRLSLALWLGPVLSSSMQLESTLQQRCLIEKTGERWRKILNPLYHPSLLSPLYRGGCQLLLFTLICLSLLLFRIHSLSLSTPPTKFLCSYPWPFRCLAPAFPLNWMSFVSPALSVASSLQRAVHGFRSSPRATGSLRASVRRHTLLMSGFLFACPYKYFHFDQWHHCVC